MPVTRLFRFSLVAAVAMGCSADATTSPQLSAFVHSAAIRACGPADGPAVAIYLTPDPVGATEPSTPYVRVYVSVDQSELTAHPWPIGSTTQAAAWFQPDASTSVAAESGNMIVNSIDSDNTINGSIEIFFPDAGHIQTDFHAKWLTNSVPCV
jgi:hypothetical protein